ncbi:MAG: OmpA family protein [Saprospiraceae bacterium]|nr:OmpA family protein [Saprospiraceae bacterium]
MKKTNPFNTIIQQLYHEQRSAEQEQAPDFSKLFDQAQQKHRKMKNQKWLAICLALLAICLIGLSFIDKEAPSVKEAIPIAKAGMPLYDILMKDGKIITNDIHFDYDNATIRSSSMAIIRSIAKMMQEHPDVRLSVEGHTDSSGSSSYNQKLSNVRAIAVRDALVSLKIDPSRLSAKGFGEDHPISSNKSESGKASNRRVEFVRQ